MTKRTPGPWTAKDVVVVNDENCRVAKTYGHYPLCETNARLIAAAPDLLAALEVARSHVSPALQPNIYEMMDAAIAKAKGEGE